MATSNDVTKKKQTADFLEAMRNDVMFNEFRARIAKAQFEEMDFTIKSFSIMDEFANVKSILLEQEEARQKGNDTPVVEDVAVEDVV